MADRTCNLSSSSINKCRYKHSEYGEVVTSCINCFSQRKSMFKMQYMLQENFLYAKDTDRNELKPGDHIAARRTLLSYEHHGMNKKHKRSYKYKRDRLVSKLKPGDHIAAIRTLMSYEHHGMNKKHMRSYKYKRDRLVSKLKPGDHIAARRTLMSYEHHGIYEGEEKGYPSVIHFQGPLKWFHKLSRSQTCINKCGYKHPKEGKVVTSCIDCFSQRRSMFKMQYMLHDDLLSAKDKDWNELTAGKLIAGYRSKKCYLEHYKNEQLYGHSSLPTKKRKRSKLDDQVRFYPEFSNRTSEEVLEVARKYKPHKYSLVCNNCEHFAVYCKTGEKKSVQSQRFNAEKRLCENGKRKRCCMSSSKNGFKKLTPEAKRRKR